MSSGYHIIPKLVEDTSLKRSRIELQDGSSAIKVSEAAPADLSPVTNTLGETDDAAWNGSDLNATVISLLKAVYDKAGKSGSIIAGFFSLTPDEGQAYFYPYPDTEEILPWRVHYGAGEYDTANFGWTPPKAGYYKASFTARVRPSSSANPALNLNYHVKDGDGTNLGSIGCIYVPSGMYNSYCIHAEFFFHVTDPTKKAYFSGYNASGYLTMSGHVVFVNDASLTYEYLGE